MYKDVFSICLEFTYHLKIFSRGAIVIGYYWLASELLKYF